MLLTVARGTIVAPNGVPQINGNCGLEIYAMGGLWWNSNACWNQARGIMEFDVRNVAVRAPFNHVTLLLQDSGSSSTGAMQSTNVWGYVGDGVRSTADWDAPAVFVQNIVRPNVAGTTSHDVTSWVNARIAAGDSFLGFRLEPGAFETFEAFGFSGKLLFD